MKRGIHFTRRSTASSVRFMGKAVALMLLFMGVINVSFLFATGELDRYVQAINSTDYMQNTGIFVLLRDSAIIPAVAIVILALVLVLLGHYLVFGPKEVEGKGADEELPWWSVTERVNHALVAVTFLVLLFSGLMITFGRFVGPGPVGVYVRQAHEFAGFAFTPFIVFMVLQWARNAIPRSYDWVWLRHVGGYLGYKEKLEAGKFNAGQKIWYLVILLGCGVLLVTGFGLFFHMGGMDTSRLFVTLHFFASIPVILMFIVHLYLATVGVKGVWRSMVNGKVSRAMVEAYHSQAVSAKSS